MIKKCFSLICFLVIVSIGAAQPKISNLSFPKEASVYGLYEISFNLGDYPNPYDPEVIDVYAIFRSPKGNTFRVNGFYFEAYNFMEKNGVEVAARYGDGDGWKIRFTPDAVGRWTYEIHGVDGTRSTQLSSYKGEALAFDCNARDAEGFVRKANAHYLKREAYVNGQRRDHSFFPVGPNVGWYTTADYYYFKKPYGIYEYQRYIDALADNANYMRIWLTRYQYLSLYGWENAIRDNGKPIMYFDSNLNQKDAAELDFIVDYAADHGITMMLCVFNYGDFKDDTVFLDKCDKRNSKPSGWRNNPFHTVLGLDRPLDFFSDPEARRITQNLLRYIVARWGYATNILSWEFWNEVDNVFKGVPFEEKDRQAIIDWHSIMAQLFSELDPHHHLLTTSLASVKGLEDFEKKLFRDLDFVQRHYYQYIQTAKSSEKLSQKLFEISGKMRDTYPLKPSFIGEYGLNSKSDELVKEKMDPFGIEIHNTLWSSLFAGTAGAASYWYWTYLDARDLFSIYRPIAQFSKTLPLLSDSFTAQTTGEIQGATMAFPNGLETYYLMNANEDTLIGWSQDEAFTFQSLRRLTDEVNEKGYFVDLAVNDPQGYVYTLNPGKRPSPSSKRNEIVIPIKNQRRGTQYTVRWFDAETGKELKSEATTITVKNSLRKKRHLAIPFPESVRDVKSGRINNSFGDAVFMICKTKD